MISGLRLKHLSQIRLKPRLATGELTYPFKVTKYAKLAIAIIELNFFSWIQLSFLQFWNFVSHMKIYRAHSNGSITHVQLLGYYIHCDKL
jgi:hypothetical protein